MKTAIIIFSGILLSLYGCSDPVNNNSAPQPVYNEIQTINLPGSYILKLYTQGYDSLTYAYNKVFFKVWLNTSLQNTGSIKVYPKMQMTPHITHSTPVSDSFTYNSLSGYYEGYIIFNMQTSPPDLVWKTRFTYIDNLGSGHVADSIPIFTSYHPEKQFKYFYDLSDTAYYTLTLVKPFSAARGISDIEFLLHRSNVYELEFLQVTDASMHINVYKQDSLYQTGGNTDPVIAPDGFYKGKINLPYNGTWIVGDTIFYNNRIITNNPPPLPEFHIDIE